MNSCTVQHSVIISKLREKFQHGIADAFLKANENSVTVWLLYSAHFLSRQS